MTTGLMPYTPEEKDRFAKDRAEIARCERINDEVRAYFGALGYRYSWDFSHRDACYWHEILDEEGTVAQIDMDVPLTDIIEDFTAWHKGRKSGTSGSKYTVNLPRNKRGKALLARVAANQRGGIQETLSL